MIKVLLTFLTLIIFVNTLSEYEDLQDHKAKFNKHYRNTQEESEAYNIFFTNLTKVRENQGKFHNGEVTYELEINNFNDRYNGNGLISDDNRKIFEIGDPVENRFTRVESGNVSESIDWRSFGVDTQVFDKRTYYEGYGWAFSTIDAVSSAYLLNNNLSVYPSAQQLIDCVQFASGEYEGLNGIQTVLFYIIDNGIATQDQYSYSGSKGTCQDVDGDLGIDFAIAVNDEDYMWRVVGCEDCGGPVLTAIDASNLLNYKSGIITGDLCPEETRTLNHAVLVVGYGSENDTDYWIAKNTWGTEWGEDGYFRITRNANNTCGIGTAGTFFSRFQK